MAPSILDEMNQKILDVFIKIEVKESIFQINPLNAPKPYRFLACFYQNNSNEIEKEVCKSVI